MSSYQAPPRGAAAEAQLSSVLSPFPSGRRRAAFRPIGAVLLLGALAACGGSDAPSGPPPVASVAFAAPAETLLVGQSRRMEVQLRDAHGRSVSQASVSWSSADEGVATVDSTGTTHARAAGETQLTASSNGRSAALRLVVRPVPVAAVTIEAPPAELTVGGSVQLVAVTRDSAGAVLPGRKVTFRSSAGEVAPVSPTGLVSALAVGQAEITAESEGRAATVAVRVSPVPVATVELVPSTLNLEVGRTVQLSTVQRGPAGQPLTSRPVTWHTTNPAAATVSETGVVRALAPGVGAIVAEVEGKVATAAVAVTAPPPQPAPTAPTTTTTPPQPVSPPALPATLGDGSYSIGVAWSGTPDARAASVVGNVVNRWARAIVGDLPNVSIDIPVDACFAGQAAEKVTVDDLLIFVRVVPIDGANGTLARAGPCYVRSGSLPVLGVVELDAADLDKTPAVIEAVLLHEFGHVLGIGTLWGRLGLLHGPSTDDPLFLGATAWSAYEELTGGDAFVPVENGGGPGTRLGHWRESVFRTELMTGWISYGGNPMSRLTIASLRDLGYRVDMTAADAYALPTSSGVNARIVGGPGAEIVDELITPRFVVDRDGTTRRVQ